MSYPDSIPLWLAPLLCIICSTCSGVTSFGDAILFQVLWAILGVAGAVPVTRDSFVLATVLTALQGASNLPVMLWQSRARLWACFPYGAVMGLTGIATVPLGTRLLFTGDLSKLKISVGALFLVFSAARLTAAALAVGRARSGAVARGTRMVLGDEDPEAPGGGAPVVEPGGDAPERAERRREGSDVACATASIGEGSSVHDANGSEVPTHSDGARAAAGAAASAASAASCTVTAERRDNDPSCRESLASRVAALPPISPTASPARVLISLAAAGVGAGLLGSMFGTAGPPQMVAFSALRVDKDNLRATAAVYSILEMLARLLAYATTASSPLAATGNAPLLGAVVVCSWLGFALGSLLRRHTDTEAILGLLLVLVFVSSGILLGVLEDVRVGAAFATVGCLWGVACAVLAMRPHWCGVK